MKITNIFLDFLLVATSWIVGSAVVLFVWDKDVVLSFIQHPLIREPTLLPLFVVVAYVFGVFLDQFSNRFLDWFRGPLGLTEIDAAKSAFGVATGRTYHQSLQFVVTHSDRGFQYLSYRRSTIRVVRALFSAFLIALVVTVVLAIQKGWVERSISPVLPHLVTIVVLTGAVMFLQRETIKLQVGYLQAIQNFANVVSVSRSPRRTFDEVG